MYRVLREYLKLRKQGKLEGRLYPVGLITRCIFCFQVDGPITGGGGGLISGWLITDILRYYPSYIVGNALISDFIGNTRHVVQIRRTVIGQYTLSCASQKHSNLKIILYQLVVLLPSSFSF